MERGDLHASVVVATRDRPGRLAALLDSLRKQTLDRSLFEVIVVDDGSTEPSSRLADTEAGRSGFELRWVRHERSLGPGATRNSGWRLARSPLVAFIDDDCVAASTWLEEGLAHCRRHPSAIVQGRTDPIPEEEQRAGPFSYTLRVNKLGPHYETCNIFYPRLVLEQFGGFDVEAFPGGGEDSDLAWRAIEGGVPTSFAERAHAFHAVHELGPVGELRRAWHWTDTMRAYARHPGLRRAHLFRGVFWRVEHYGLIRILLLPLIPRRLRLLRRWFTWRWLAELGARAIRDGGGVRGIVLMPYLVVHDLVEIASVIRGAIRYRTPIL